jgi:hypothetical protein
MQAKIMRIEKALHNQGLLLFNAKRYSLYNATYGFDLLECNIGSLDKRFSAMDKI